MRTPGSLCGNLRAAIRSCSNRIHFGLWLRAVVIALMVAAVMISPDHPRAAQDDCSTPPKEGCFIQPRMDLVFMIDSSGSIASRGQTYNIELEGLQRALRDPATIPRDGSIAVSVVVFNGAATVAVSLTDINSPADAEEIAGHIEALKCANLQSQTAPCPFGETRYSPAILIADIDASHVRSLNPKPGARRVMILSSDGQPEDLEQAIQEVNKARIAATLIGVQFEFDAFLVGLNSVTSPEYASAKAGLDRLVSPQPAGDLPGAVLPIEGGPCNLNGADFSEGVGCWHKRGFRSRRAGQRPALAETSDRSFQLQRRSDAHIPGRRRQRDNYVSVCSAFHHAAKCVHKLL